MEYSMSFHLEYHLAQVFFFQVLAIIITYNTQHAKVDACLDLTGCPKDFDFFHEENVWRNKQIMVN